MGNWMRFIIKYGGGCAKNPTPQTGFNQNNLESRLPGTGNQKRMKAAGPKGIMTLWLEILLVSAVPPRILEFWKKPDLFWFFLRELSKCLKLWEYKMWPIIGFLVGQGNKWIWGRELVQVTQGSWFPLEMVRLMIPREPVDFSTTLSDVSLGPWRACGSFSQKTSHESSTHGAKWIWGHVVWRLLELELGFISDSIFWAK